MAIKQQQFPKTVLDAVAASRQVGFDVVVEQSIGYVEISEDGVGMTPVVTAFAIVAEHVEKRTKVDGEADLTFRFEVDGKLFRISTEVR